MARGKKKIVTEETGAVKISPVVAESVKTEEAETAKVETAEAEPEKSSTPEKVAEMPKEKKKAAKTTAKKPAAKKEVKVKAVVEYQGKQVEEKDIMANVKKAWTKSGKKVRDLKSVDLYIKPEEDKVYYVINGTDTGAVAF